MSYISQRRRLVFHVNIAQTPEQIRAVKGHVKNWQKKFPKDKIVEKASRQLAKTEEWLKTNGKWH
jgi:hypothetical protein